MPEGVQYNTHFDWIIVGARFSIGITSNTWSPAKKETENISISQFVSYLLRFVRGKCGPCTTQK